MKGVRWEKYRNTMIHVTVTVLLLLVVDEVFWGFFENSSDLWFNFDFAGSL